MVKALFLDRTICTKDLGSLPKMAGTDSGFDFHPKPDFSDFVYHSLTSAVRFDLIRIHHPSLTLLIFQ